MSRPWALLAGGAVIGGAALVWWSAAPRGEVVVLDLVEALPSATRSPAPDVFAAVQARLGDDTRPAILTTGASRLTWRVDVPDDAWLRLALALREDAWQIEGDGVFFQVGVSDGTEYVELFSLMVNPFRHEMDRGWHELALDLGEYAGRPIDVIFNTRASAPDAPVDTRGDLALWGAPRIVAR